MTVTLLAGLMARLRQRNRRSYTNVALLTNPRHRYYLITRSLSVVRRLSILREQCCGPTLRDEARDATAHEKELDGDGIRRFQLLRNTAALDRTNAPRPQT